MMILSGMLVSLLFLASSVNSLSIDSTALVRTKRQLKVLCSAELYSGPLTKICDVPKDYNLDSQVKKYVAQQKKPNLYSADSVCVFFNSYLDKKWVNTKGELDAKKLSSELLALTKDAEWKKIVPAVCARCIKDATDGAKLPLKSGYKTSCKLAPYMFQTCFVSKLYNNCPKKHQKADYQEAVTALAGCDPQAPVKTAEDTAKGAIGRLASMDKGKLTASIQKVKSNAKQIEAALPKDILSKIGDSVPKGTDVNKFDASKVEAQIKSADPMALAKGFNLDPSMLNMFGK